MHDDRELLERRIAREVAERLVPLIVRAERPLLVHAGIGPDEIDLDHPVAVGTRWGPPWGTTWFALSGDVPAAWCDEVGADDRIEVMLDLGFHPDAAGFQSEGLVVQCLQGAAVAAVGCEPIRRRALQGIHPQRTAFTVDPVPGPLRLIVEAASNPRFPGYRPSPLGSLEDIAAAGRTDEPQYELARCDLVVIDAAAEQLAHDVDVAHRYLLTLPTASPRRARLTTAVVAALDALPDVDRARLVLRGELGDVAQFEHAHRIVAVGHAHIDTAWLWPMRETRRKCIRTFASAAALMDDDPDYVFVCSQAQQYAWIEAAEPELFERIRERVARGQWVPVGGMWVEADMNLPSGESLVRQLVHGQRYFEERFGVRCTEVWIPDVFGYPAGLPQVFAAAGMHRFVTQKLSWNKQNRFPHHTFWWEGLDGTRLLTHFPPVDTYNAEIVPHEVAHSVANFREHRWSRWSLMPFGYGDGGGGPTREMLARSKRMAELDPEWHLRIGTPAEMFAAVEAEAAAGAPVPVWRGELYFETHRGTLTSQLATKVGNRRCERLLVEAELWAATVGRVVDLDELWQTTLTQQFHDILPGSSIRWVHDDAVATFTAVERDVETIIEHLLSAAAPGADPGVAAVANPAVANPAGVDIDAVVARGDGCGRWVRAPAFGIGEVTAPPDDVAPVRVDRVGRLLTNDVVTMTWDERGAITSLVDHGGASDREVVPAGASAAVVELAVDHPVEYDAWDVEAWTRASGRSITGADAIDGDVVTSIDVVDDPLVGAVTVRHEFGPSAITLAYRLCAGARRLDIDVDLDWHHDERLLSIAFPLDVRADTASCDVQFGVVERPTHPSNPWDAAKFEVCAHRFVDVSEPGFGVAVLNTGRYGHGLFGGAVRVSLARAACYPDPAADRGRHSVSLALLPHDGDLAAVRAAAEALNRPPRFLSTAGAAKARAPVVRIVDAGASRPAHNVEVDAVKLADDGSGELVVRLHEHVGRRTAITVALGAGPVSSAALCDLLEEPVAEPPAVNDDGTVTLELRPFQLLTLRLAGTG